MGGELFSDQVIGDACKASDHGCNGRQVGGGGCHAQALGLMAAYHNWLGWGRLFEMYFQR